MLALIVSFVAIVIGATAFGASKSAARRRFREAAEHYVFAREQRIANGEDPAGIPTVEQWCAANGVSHHLMEIGWTSKPEPRPARIVTREAPAYHPDVKVGRDVDDRWDDEDGYADFVRQMWSRPGVSLAGIVVERVVYTGERIPSALLSLVSSEPGRAYVNTVENGRRLTLAAGSRHKWFRDGERVDDSAWLAIERGVAPDVALRRERYAGSALEAMSPAFNRVAGRGRRYVIRYRNEAGDESWRVVSHVVRQADRFSAVCHFRYGTRRTFMNAGVLDVLNPETGEVMSVSHLLSKLK